jgi:plexin A
MESLDRIKCVFKMSDWKPITCYCDHNSSHSKDFNKNKNFNIRNREKSCFRSTGFLLIKTMFILKIIVCLLANNCRALSSHSSSVSSSIVATYFTTNQTINFTHIASDQSGRIYVGASNWLYQFNGSLDMEVALQTGPVQDSPQCSPSDCSDIDVSSISANNVNKVLVVDEDAKVLLVCGTVHQGSCRRHRLGAISHHEELIPLPIAANDENSSTLAFIGPSRYFGTRVQPVLYVAATNSRLGPYRDMVPAIASRSLEPGPKYLTIIEKSFSDNAKVDIEFHMKDYFLVNYVYGFATQDFVYFATVQKKSHLRYEKIFFIF